MRSTGPDDWVSTHCAAVTEVAHQAIPFASHSNSSLFPIAALCIVRHKSAAYIYRPSHCVVSLRVLAVVLSHAPEEACSGCLRRGWRCRSHKR